jgi:hypothetical protein
MIDTQMLNSYINDLKESNEIKYQQIQQLQAENEELKRKTSKKGKWLMPTIGKFGVLCSECKTQHDNMSKFCSECGVDMLESEE